MHVISFKDGTHENRRPTAPNTGLDQVAGNRLVKDPLDEFLDVVQALPADHGERLVRRPLAPFVDMRTRLVNVVENYLFRELKVKAAKMLFPLCFGEGAVDVFGKRLVRLSTTQAIHRGTVAWFADILTVAPQGAKHRSKSAGFDGPFAILLASRSQ